MAASYICNCIPHSALNMETPHKTLYGKDTDLSHLKIIGAKAFVHIKSPNKWHVVGRDGVRHQRDQEQLLPHLEPKKASRDGKQEHRFNQNTTKSSSRGQAALAATRYRVTVVRFQRRHARRQLTTSRTMTCCGACITIRPLWISASARLPER